MDYTQEIQKALLARMRFDAEQSRSLSGRLGRAQDLLRGEAEAWLKAYADESPIETSNLTLLQERINKAVEELDARFQVAADAMLDPVDTDAVAEAVAELISGLAGHILGLEVRISALEIAVGQS